MPCEPAPPCEPNFPFFCDPLPTTNDGRRLVVEDSASCQKTIPIPSGENLLGSNLAGALEWKTGAPTSVLQYTAANKLEFVNGSSAEPFKLPSLQTHTPDNATELLVMLPDGTVKKWEPTSIGNNFLAYWDGSDWRINTLNNLLPSGNGILIRNSTGNLTVVPSGVSGASLQMVGSNIQFVAAPANQFPGGHLYGLILSNSGTSLDNDIQVAAGECRAASNTQDIFLTSPIVKQLNNLYAPGSNAGGVVDADPKQANSSYHAFVITDGSAVDVCFSTSIVPTGQPNFPGGFSQHRRIGAVTTDGSNNIRQFTQVGDRFLYHTMAKDVVRGNTVATGGLYTISVPNGIKVHPILNVSAYTNYWKVYDPDQTFAAAQSPYAYNNTATNYLADSYSYSYGQFHPFGVMTNTQRQIGIDSNSIVSGWLCIDTHGFFDARGRLQP
jgi:hypothetical protein